MSRFVRTLHIFQREYDHHPKHRNDFITQSRELLGGKVEPLLYALLDVLNYCYEQNQLERLAREVGYMFLA